MQENQISICKSEEQEKVMRSECLKLEEVITKTLGKDYRGRDLAFAKKAGMNRGYVSQLKEGDVYLDPETGEIFKLKLTKVGKIKG